jgi:quinol monooxygenase YgiN
VGQIIDFMLERRAAMYTRLVEFKFRTEYREKVEAILKDFMPIMKAQAGFTDVVTMMPEAERNEIIALSFWTTKAEALRFEEQTFPKLVDLLKDYLITTPHVRVYMLATSTLHKTHVRAA